MKAPSALHFAVGAIAGFLLCHSARAAGTMLLEDLDEVFRSNTALHKTLTDAFTLHDRASATGKDTTRATDRNPPFLLFAKPKDAPGDYTVQIELQLAPKSWPQHPRLIALRVTPIDPETQKTLRGE